MTNTLNFNPRIYGNKKADIVVVCEPPRDESNSPMSEKSLSLFRDIAHRNGIDLNNILFLQHVPPVPEEIAKSDSRKKKWAEPFTEVVDKIIGIVNPKLVVTLGDLATKQITKSSVKFSNVRGTLIETSERKIFPITSPINAIVRPEQMPTFVSDVVNLSSVINAGYVLKTQKDKDYRYVEDISFLLENPPELVAFDTETTGLDTHDPNVKVLVVQLTWKNNQAIVLPVDRQYWDWTGRENERLKLISQLKNIMENPKVKKIGQNIAFDILMLRKLGIDVKGIYADTELWAWGVDENLLQKNIDNLCKIYLPEMSGYNDEINATIDKSRMMDVPHDTMLKYAGGDTDATFQLFHVLDEKLKREPSQRRLLFKVQMPALVSLIDMTNTGVRIDVDYLRELKPVLWAELDEKYRQLMELVPAAVVQKHYNPKKKNGDLNFSRDRFIIDIMFSKEGFGLTPVVFTDSTKLLDPSERVPSASAKTHFPFFLNAKGDAGKFVSLFMEYTKLEKLLSTYVDPFEEKYVSKDNRVHSNFTLARTVTGRIASSNPNLTNLPARGPYAKKYKKMFIPSEGKVFVSADSSQAELRLIAHRAADPVMLDLYANDVDIHTYTAQKVLDISDYQWANLTPEEKKLNRFKAKAVNFGRVYGMRDKKFQLYAKTDYGLDLSLDEAKKMGQQFFKTYPRLQAWHQEEINFLRKHGYVITIDGQVRHLPSIYSEDDAVRASAERQAINSVIQGPSSRLALDSLVRIRKQQVPQINPILFIHDDNVMEVDVDFAWEAANAIVWTMRNHRLYRLTGERLTVGMKGEPDIGYSLGEMYELMDLPKDAPQWIKDLPPIDPLNPVKPSWWDDSKDR